MIASRTSANRSWLFLSVAIIILFIFAYYFLVIVQSKEDKLVRKAYRILNNIERNINEKKTNYDRSITEISFCRMVNEGFLNPEIKAVYKQKNKLNSSLNQSPLYEDPEDGKIYYFRQYPEDSVLNAKHEQCSEKFDSLTNENIDTYGGKIDINTFMSNVKYDDFFTSIALFDSTKTFYVFGPQNYQLNELDTINQLISKNPGAFQINIELQDQSYRVFIQPIVLGQHVYYLAGLVRSDVMVKKARQINPHLFFAGIVIIIFLLINMPLFKLFLINRYERLKTSDAVQVSLTLIMGGSLLVLILLNAYEHLVNENKKSEKELKTLSEHISANLDVELDSIINEMVDIKVEKLICDQTQLAKHTFVFDPNSPEYKLNSYPNINEFLFINKDGMVQQFISYDFNDEKLDSRLYNLNYRDYFSIVNDHLGWHYARRGLKNFYIQSIYSWSKGTGEAAISVTADEINGDSSKCFAVAAITAPLTAVMNTILPEGFGFAVIDNNGSVIFHSDSRKNLMENLIDETDTNLRLKVSIDNRVAEWINIDYNEQSYKAYVAPRKDLPFFLVTFYDKQLSREKNARIINYTFLFLLTNLFVLVVVFSLIWVVMRLLGKYEKNSSIIDWLRPIKENRLLYFYLLLLNSAVVIIQFIHFYHVVDIGETLKFNILVSVYISVYNYLSLVILNKSSRKFDIKPTILPKLILVLIMFVLAVISGFNGLFLVILIVSALADFLFLVRFREFKLPVFIPVKKAFSSYYLGFVFIWIMSIGVLTTLTSLKVISQDENQLWLQSRQMSVVQQYLARKKKLVEQWKKHQLPEQKFKYQLNRGIYAGFYDSSSFSIKDSLLHGDPLMTDFSEQIYRTTRPAFSNYDERLRSFLHDPSKFKNIYWNRNEEKLQFQVSTLNPFNDDNEFATMISELRRLPFALYHREW